MKARLKKDQSACHDDRCRGVGTESQAGMFFINNTRHRDPETMAAFTGASGEFEAVTHQASPHIMPPRCSLSDFLGPRVIEGLLLLLSRSQVAVPPSFSVQAIDKAGRFEQAPTGVRRESTKTNKPEHTSRGKK